MSLVLAEPHCVIDAFQLSYFYDDVEDKIVALCKEAPDLSEL